MNYQDRALDRQCNCLGSQESDSAAYDEASLFNIAGELGVLGQETITCKKILETDETNLAENEAAHTRMDHLSPVLNSDFDNLVAGEVSANWGVLPTLADDICLIGLCACLSVQVLDTHIGALGQKKSLGPTLSVHREPVLIATQLASATAKEEITAGVSPEDGNGLKG